MWMVSYINKDVIIFDFVFFETGKFIQQNKPWMHLKEP